MDPAADELLNLRRELEQLRGHEHIRTCVCAYARALDRLDRELLARQFWPDATVDYGTFFQGPAREFIDVAMRFQGSMRDTHHLVGNVLVSLEGARASAESYVQASHVLLQDGERVQLLVGARYLDRFELRGGEWRLSYRTEVLDWGRWLPVSERWFEENREMPKGLRSRADLSYRFLGARTDAQP